MGCLPGLAILPEEGRAHLPQNMSSTWPGLLSARTCITSHACLHRSLGVSVSQQNSIRIAGLYSLTAKIASDNKTKQMRNTAAVVSHLRADLQKPKWYLFSL